MAGNFSYLEGEKCRAYGPSKDGSRIACAAAGMLTMPEARKNDEPFKLARQWFDEAEHIAFVGFGFDELNCERLGLNDVLVNGKRHARKIYASSFGRTAVEMGTARRNTCASINWITMEEK